MLDEYFKDCLFFSSLAFHREIARMADRAFLSSGLSPMDAFLLMTIAEHPGISQREAGERLGQLESTISRAVRTLRERGILDREVEGKTARLSLAEKGRALMPVIEDCWNQLYAAYCAALGEERAEALTAELFSATKKLS